MSTARSAWMDDLPDAVAEALNPALDPDEQVEMTLQAVGCTLVLTDRQLIMVRQGADFRPRTGVTSWRRDAVRRISMSTSRIGCASSSIRGRSSAPSSP